MGRGSKARMLERGFIFLVLIVLEKLVINKHEIRSLNALRATGSLWESKDKSSKLTKG